MAPYKKPRTLLNVSMEFFTLMVVNACETIEEKYGTWDTLECKNAILQFQQFLLSQVPRKWLDLIYNEFSPRHLSCDPRIYIAMCMHKNMREFRICQAYNFKLYTDISFWTTMLSHTSNIVYLNLSNICSDVILEIVSNNCVYLEYINLSSRRKRICISDAALMSLDKCTKLKTIILDEGKYLFGTAGKTITPGISHLLKNLPALENISYGNMGPVILDVKDEVESLALKQINFYEPEVSHIIGVSTLCNNLQKLCLSFQFLQSRSEEFITDIYAAIRTSSLHLSILKLIHFVVNEALIELLSVKGQYLNSFILDADKITGQVSRAIGRYCPDIIHLELHRNAMSATEASENISFHPDREMFTNLESLTLWGIPSTNFNVILPIVLPHAKQIQKLKLKVKGTSSDTDEIMNNILRRNPMRELNELYTHCALSMNTISYFFQRPEINKLSFLKHAGITSDDVCTLNEEITRNNLDIFLHVLG